MLTGHDNVGTFPFSYSAISSAVAYQYQYGIAPRHTWMVVRRAQLAKNRIIHQFEESAKENSGNTIIYENKITRVNASHTQCLHCSTEKCYVMFKK